MSATNLETSLSDQDLLTALEDEINVRSRYDAYAVKADVDGLHGIASLFRALAWAEGVHAENVARVIRQSGGNVKGGAHSFPVGTTRENLKIAVGGELCETETIYPKFLEDASGERKVAAFRTFRCTLESEKAHARLLKDALKLAETTQSDPRIAAAQEFYVCSLCGYVSETRDGRVCCPVCSCPQEHFEPIC